MKKFLSIVFALVVVAFSATACESFAKDTSVQNFEKNIFATEIGIMV